MLLDGKCRICYIGFNEETVDDDTAKRCDTILGADRPSNRLLIQNLVMECFATIMKRNMDIFIEQREWSTSFTLEVFIETVEMYS